MLTGNKGEWSEVYALFKLLGDGKVYAGDKNLNKLTTLFFPIIKVIKNELGKDHEYLLNGNIILVDNGNNKFEISVTDFQKYAIKLLKKIKSESGTFGDAEIEEFMASFASTKLKAKSSVKNDIRIVLHDLRINQAVNLGFSIKSELGGDSTLLNAGQTTNFVYKVEGYNFSQIEIDAINNINSKSKIKDRIVEIINKGATITFYDTNRILFKNNLILIDSLLPNILGELTYNFYSSNLNTIRELTEEMQNHNPLNYDLQFLHSFYEYKIKRFLTDVALGMMPSQVWLGNYDASGGHLIVKKNGDVLCYHIYDRNQFEDYLFQNTRLETASSTRHQFGIIYKEGNGYFFKLNLQVRF